jgi:hypothetical protein
MVPVFPENHNDPRSHANQREPKYFLLELDVTLEVRPFGSQELLKADKHK